MKKTFVIDIKIQRSIRVFDDDGPYKIEAHREFDVTDNTRLDEIMDIPIGQLILGSAYKKELRPGVIKEWDGDPETAFYERRPDND